MGETKKQRSLAERKAMSKYDDVNLKTNDVHFDFINELIKDLNDIFQKEEISLCVYKNKSYEVRDGNIDLLTPEITGICIVVNEVLTVEFHALMNGICLFDLFIVETYRRIGLGRKVLMKMCQISDYFDLPIFLIPVDYTGSIDKQSLMSFYHSCDFKQKNESDYWEYVPKVTKMVA